MADQDIVIYKGAELTDEMIQADPERYKILSNGATYDRAAGYIVKAPPAEMQTITQENASALAHSRWEAARQAAAEGMAIAGKDLAPSNVTEYDAYREMVKAQTKLSWTVEKGRASTEAARFVARAADMMPDRGNNVQPNGSNTLALSLSDGIAGKVLELLGKVNGMEDDVSSDNSKYQSFQTRPSGRPSGRFFLSIRYFPAWGAIILLHEKRSPVDTLTLLQ